MAKKSKSQNEVDQVMEAFFSILGSGRSSNPFTSFFKAQVNPLDLGILGQGLYLIDIEGIKDPHASTLHYGNLYRKSETGKVFVINGVAMALDKINDKIFRVGGMCSGFKTNDYCELIHYEHISTKDNACLGNHCIIDTKGQIVFEADSCIKYPYYHKGCIIKYENLYINLKTGLPIVSGYRSIDSENFLFVECSCYKNEFPKGVYKIEYATGNFEVFK